MTASGIMTRAFLLRLAAAALAAVMALGLPQSALSQDALEYAVKANYLNKFAPFVEWPDAAFVTATSPFYLCIAGDDRFGAALDQAVRGQFVKQHPVTVRRLKNGETANGCHTLFVGSSRGRPAADIVRSVRGDPVLTVTDQSARGAIIQFVTLNNRVRFSIDTEAAAANRVNISSKLLSLATTVKPAGGG